VRLDRRASWLALAGILVVAAAVRVWAFTGPSFSFGSDESRFIALAQNLANGYFPSGDAEWFGSRIVLLWPVAGLFRLFGAGDVVATIWPFAGSLVAVVATYLVGREIASNRVGLVAASAVALAPLEALAGTHLRPDAIMPGLLALGVWCALRASTRGWLWAFGAGLFLGLAWSVRESALVLAPVLVLAGWGAGRRALAAGAAGAAIVPAAAIVIYAVGAGEPLRPLVAAGTEGEWRNPVEAFSFDGSYVAAVARAAFNPRSSLFLLGPMVLIALAVLLYRRDRRAAFPAIWLAWTGLYLEFGTLVNLAKPLRYLTLCAVPAAVLIALAIDGRFAFLAPIGFAAIAVSALWSLPARDLRHDNVTLVANVIDRLRELPSAPTLTEDYVWWAKITTYTATKRLTIPLAADPELAPASVIEQRRRLKPLPEPDDYRGGYIVTGPINVSAGWPSNWGRLRSRMAREIPRAELVPVSRIDHAMIWRWPR
jgi:4-amino-4-deoxy-L-arabinose transferase-like glycosyltransferase